MEGVDVIMSEGVDVDLSLVAVREVQNGGGTKKDGGQVSPPEAVGHRYAMNGKIMQVSFDSDKHYSDLDVYLQDLRPKLTTNFLDLLDKLRVVR